MNLLLHHSIHKNSAEQIRHHLVLILDFITYKHNHGVDELYLYLHKNFDPMLVQNMIDAKNPGLLDCFIKAIENVTRRPIITQMTNYISGSDLFEECIEIVKANRVNIHGCH